MRATILCPTHNHGRLIQSAIRSVLRQTHQDFEIFIIGDGMDDATRAAAGEILSWDKRVTLLDKEKSPRHGEPYRHEVLTQQATGDFVCYISDDDLWMPHHLQTMAETLHVCDVAHSRGAFVSPEGTIITFFMNWSAQYWREWLLNPPAKNGAGLSQGGHRMDFYKRLPFGWRTTPKGSWSDHYMWVQLLSQPDVRAACTEETTTILFPSPLRLDMTLEERCAELVPWEKRIQDDPQALRADLNTAVANWEAANIQHWESRSAQLDTFEQNHHAEMKRLHAEISRLNSDLVKAHETWSLAVTNKQQEVARLKEQNEKAKSLLTETRVRLTEERTKVSLWKNRYAKLPKWLRSFNKRVWKRHHLDDAS